MYAGQTCVQTETDDVIRDWVSRAAQDDILQRRKNSRYPFFRAASIQHDGRSLWAFCRDISPRGIGLLHVEPLETGKTNISIWLGEKLVDIEAELTWCAPVAGGWWLSGGRLTKVSSSQYASLTLSTIGREVERRFHRRYPFIRPLTVVAGKEGKRVEHNVVSLDISSGGVSLLVNQRLDPQIVLMQTLASHDVGASEIRGRVVTCRELQNSSFVIGVEFVSLQITELC